MVGNPRFDQELRFLPLVGTDARSTKRSVVTRRTALSDLVCFPAPSSEPGTIGVSGPEGLPAGASYPMELLAFEIPGNDRDAPDQARDSGDRRRNYRKAVNAVCWEILGPVKRAKRSWGLADTPIMKALAVPPLPQAGERRYASRSRNFQGWVWPWPWP